MSKGTVKKEDEKLRSEVNKNVSGYNHAINNKVKKINTAFKKRL